MRVARRPRGWQWLAAASGAGVLIMWVSGYVPWAWWRDHEIAAVSRAVPPRAPPTGRTGVVRPTPQGTNSSVSTVPLALHLATTRPGRNSLEGYAEIGVNVHSPQTYRAGAVLANGARLAEVYADSVVLERNGQQSRLYLEGRGPATSDAVVLPSIVTVGGTTPARPASVDSHDTLTDVVRIAPVFAGDQVRALVIYPSAHPEIFGRLGFEPGDRIIAIDGAAVKDVREAITALRQVTAGAAVILTIERDGEHLILSVDGSIVQSGDRG